MLTSHFQTQFLFKNPQMKMLERVSIVSRDLKLGKGFWDSLWEEGSLRDSLIREKLINRAQFEIARSLKRLRPKGCEAWDSINSPFGF